MPHIVVIAGSNGSGKSTAAPALLQGTIHINDFVNADVIAQGLSPFHPEKAAIHAGRIMLDRIKQLANNNESFAFETTLASKTFAGWIRKLKEQREYQFELVFLWLDNVELAISRVAERFRLGGHSVPEETIKRRYISGLKNFFNLYSSLANSWQFYDNSRENILKPIAFKKNKRIDILDNTTWKHLIEVYSD